MKLLRLRFSKEASYKLSQLKGRTGITPNILARIGFMMSLTDPTIPNPDDYPGDGDKEIERQVLLGHWDLLFVASLKERCIQDRLDVHAEDVLNAQLRAHMNRGVLLLHKRVKELKDLGLLMPREFTSSLSEVLEDTTNAV